MPDSLLPGAMRDCCLSRSSACVCAGERKTADGVVEPSIAAFSLPPVDCVDLRARGEWRGPERICGSDCGCPQSGGRDECDCGGPRKAAAAALREEASSSESVFTIPIPEESSSSRSRSVKLAAGSVSVPESVAGGEGGGGGSSGPPVVHTRIHSCSPPGAAASAAPLSSSLQNEDDEDDGRSSSTRPWLEKTAPEARPPLLLPPSGSDQRSRWRWSASPSLSKLPLPPMTSPWPSRSRPETSFMATHEGRSTPPLADRGLWGATASISVTASLASFECPLTPAWSREELRFSST
mmetsp:Transcript_30886/g.92566  ORF Transcript_30886/g.92566 Transcript_30886/m.92566 type:complete len:295 (+) Transcript_30886:3512-4396(+)